MNVYQITNRHQKNNKQIENNIEDHKVNEKKEKSTIISSNIVNDINNYLSRKNNTEEQYSNAIFIDLKKQQNIKEIFNFHTGKKCKKRKTNICYFFKYIIVIACSIVIAYSISYLGLEIKHSNFNELNEYMEIIGDKLDNIIYLNNNLDKLNTVIENVDYNTIYSDFKEMLNSIKDLNNNINSNLKYLANANSYNNFINNNLNNQYTNTDTQNILENNNNIPNINNNPIFNPTTNNNPITNNNLPTNNMYDSYPNIPINP